MVPESADWSLEQIRNELLRRLVLAFFPAQDALMVREVLHECRFNENAFWRALHELSEEGLIKLLSTGPRYRIEAAGVLLAEESGLVPTDLAILNNRVRAKLLGAYARVYDEEGPRATHHYQAIETSAATETGADTELVDANLQFLFDIGHLKHPSSMGHFAITDAGLEAYREWRQRTELLETFNALGESDDPQERGRQFQHLFGEFVNADHWSVEESVRNPGEEIDLILHRQDAFYLLECRWTREPVGAKDIRDFAGKLRKRAAVYGLFVSVGGFTSDARVEVESGSGDTPILLVGPEEVRDLFERTLVFDELLLEKKQMLVMQRTARWR